MKDCRFCGAMIPYYGADACSKCLDREPERNVVPSPLPKPVTTGDFVTD